MHLTLEPTATRDGELEDLNCCQIETVGGQCTIYDLADVLFRLLVAAGFEPTTVETVIHREGVLIAHEPISDQEPPPRRTSI